MVELPSGALNQVFVQIIVELYKDFACVSRFCKGVIRVVFDVFFIVERRSALNVVNNPLHVIRTRS